MTWHVKSLAAGDTETLPFKLKAVAKGEHVQEIVASAARGLSVLLTPTAWAVSDLRQSCASVPPSLHLTHFPNLSKMR